MDNNYQFIITQHNPRTVIFDGRLTFAQARQYMDEHATVKRSVSFEVFNEVKNRWENFDNVFYYGGRKVYDNGKLYILDPDYRGMWLPESQQWHLWCTCPNGDRKFCQSFQTRESADERADILKVGRDDYQYVVCLSDIPI